MSLALSRRLGRVLASPLLPPILALLVYSPVLSYGLLWDDPVILDKQLPSLSIVKVFVPPAGLEQASRYYYRPVSMLTFVLNRAIYGKNPFGYHATVWLLHAAAVYMVFRLGRRIMAPDAACLGAALFAVFPLHAESVAWIAGRTDILMTLFCAWAAEVYLKQLAPLSTTASPHGAVLLRRWDRPDGEGGAARLAASARPPGAAGPTVKEDRGRRTEPDSRGSPSPSSSDSRVTTKRPRSGGRNSRQDGKAPGSSAGARPGSSHSRDTLEAAADGSRMMGRGGLVACAALFVVALLSKESAIALAPVLVSGAWLAGWRGRKLLAAFLTALGPPLLYLFLRSSLSPTGTASPLSQLDPASLVRSFRTLAWFLVRLTLPYPGSPYRLAPPEAVWIIPISLAVVVGGLILGVKWKREGRIGMVFLLLWIAASLLAGTTAAAFNLSRTPVADRYLYTPAAGWCLVLAALIAGRSRAATGLSAATERAAATEHAAATGHTVATGHTAATGQTAVRAQTVATGHSAAGHSAAKGHSGAGSDKAEDRPEPGEHIREGVVREKLRSVPSSVRLAAGWLLALLFAGLTVARSPIYRDDFAFWSAATLADPSAGSAQINFAGALWDRGDHEAAARAYGRALELPLAPEDRAMALTSLGALLNSSGQLDQAEKAFREAVSIPGAGSTATFNLGSFLYEKGTRLQQQNDRSGARAVLLEARPWLEKAAEQAPQDARAWLLLGNCYREEGRWEPARLAWSRVLEIEGETGPRGKEAAASLRQIP